MDVLTNYRAHKGKFQYVAGLAVGGLIGVFAFWASNHGANAGHLVTFLGGLCGTGLAVTAAVRIENWKRKLDKEEKYANVVEYLKELKKNLLYYHLREIRAGDDVRAQISLNHDYMGAFLEWSEDVSKNNITNFDSMRYLFWARKTGKNFVLQLEYYERRLDEGARQDDIHSAFKTLCQTPTYSLTNLINSLEEVGKL